MKFIKNHKGYQIHKNRDENFVVTTPAGEKWGDHAANRETAEKWIDLDIYETNKNLIRRLAKN